MQPPTPLVEIVLANSNSTNHSNSTYQEKPKNNKRANSIDVKSSEYGPPPKMSTLSLQERYNLCLSVAEECVQPEELRVLLERNPNPICYDGFEPSGRMHIAQGVVKAINVNKLTKSGCVFVFWVADWFAMLNDKMGGDLEKIKLVGQYFIEVWKAVGMDLTNVRFVWTSEEIEKNSNGYWERVMDIARRNTITRMKRCCQIMGRGEGDGQPAAQILYPCMQCADIFYLKADICQLGMDQRKVNMLAREYADQIKLKQKPVILSHEMVPGLLEGQEKMSKSDPDSAIFMEDSAAEVNRKIKKAYCPPQVVEGNPILAYVRLIILPWFGKLTVPRKEQNGGDVTYDKYETLVQDYASGILHPGDLKPALAAALNQILQPVRDHFQNDPKASELLKTITKFKVSR